jgi:hypothetical protein
MRDVIKKKIELDRPNVDWFEQAYPGGSLTGLINGLLEKFRHLHDAESKDFVAIAAKQVKEEMGE